MIERYYPKEENLGNSCQFWNRTRCQYPKFEMEGRTSCEGIIDDVCLWLKNKRTPKSLTSEQLLELRIKPPSASKHHIPPGGTQ